MAKTVKIAGATYSNVPAVSLPDGSGKNNLFYDCVGSKDITANGSNIDVKGLETVNVNVPSSGGGMNVQAYHGTGQSKTTSYSSTGVSISVKASGTYKVSWTAYRNTTSGTNGTQLYIGNSAYGSAQTSWTNSYGQSVVLTGVSLTAGQTVEVRARARSTSYVVGVGNLVIEQTA